MQKQNKGTLSQNDIEQITNALQNGGVIGFPTDTVWGLGADPTNEVAIKKIYDLKKRDGNKPLILMSSDIEYLRPFVLGFCEEEERVIHQFFPGALTLITKKSKLTPDYVTSGFDTVGIRIPNHPIFAKVAECSPCKVLATTSANLSCQPSALKKEASHIVIVHNHPSGNPAPSQADFQLTQTLHHACVILAIRLLDHIIVTQDKFYSFRQSGFLE